METKTFTLIAPGSHLSLILTIVCHSDSVFNKWLRHNCQKYVHKKVKSKVIQSLIHTKNIKTFT